MRKVLFAHNESLHLHQNFNYGFSSVGLDVIFTVILYFLNCLKVFCLKVLK